MRAPLVVAALALGLALPHLVNAQISPSAGTGTQSRQAPVGHRQPQAKDVPPDQRASSYESAKDKEQDRALDRALKGICRGC